MRGRRGEEGSDGGGEMSETLLLTHADQFHCYQSKTNFCCVPTSKKLSKCSCSSSGDTGKENTSVI